MYTRFLPLVVACCAAFGQTFEAASIKPPTALGPMGMMADQKGGPGTTDPGTFSCQNCTLHWVMADAFDIHPYDFFAPDWLDSARFDFQAKVPPGTTKEQFQAMLQNLLAERFKMAVHREKRSMTVYELTVGKGGPKFKESSPDVRPETPSEPYKFHRDADGFPVLQPGRSSMGLTIGHGRLHLGSDTLDWFVRILSGQIKAPVNDATGLKGKYDFTVSWTWDDEPGAASAAAASLISAMQSELGLKLERKKGDVEVLIVDHMEKTPTAN